MFDKQLSMGQALSQPIRAAMELLFGADLRNVRVHAGSSVPPVIGARAFAFRDHIHFAWGEYDPCTVEGWRLLGHEIAHVVQQRCRRVPTATEPLLLSDPELEREADAAGDLAAAMFATRQPPGRALHAGPVPAAHAGGFAIQCLMSVKEFETATAAHGLRNKLAAIDNDLKEFHRLDGAKPRDYVKILAQFRKVYEACRSYKQQQADSKTIGGVDNLIKEIAAEETVLVPLAEYYKETVALKQFDALESAQENFLKMKNRPHFNRRNCAVELKDLLGTVEQKGEGTFDAAVVQREIDELAALADRDLAPQTLKSIILEVTAAANVRQLDKKLFRAGAAYNTANGSSQKYTVKHELQQHYGKKWRLGSLLHELTHISIAETFGNTVLMLAIKQSATNDEILGLARGRRADITQLKQLINSTNDLDYTLREELLAQAEYPVCGKFIIYLTNFKPRLGDAVYDRLFGLAKRGLDCELIEYDTVVNQMALWCCLSGLNESHPVYRDLLIMAREAYQYRASNRLAHSDSAGTLAARQRAANRQAAFESLARGDARTQDGR